jgi:hypothetical protein
MMACIELIYNAQREGRSAQKSLLLDRDEKGPDISGPFASRISLIKQLIEKG